MSPNFDRYNSDRYADDNSACVGTACLSHDLKHANVSPTYVTNSRFIIKTQ